MEFVLEFLCVKTESSAEGRTIPEILKDLKTKFLEAFDYLDCIQVRFAVDKVQSQKRINYIKKHVEADFILKSLTPSEAEKALTDIKPTFEDSHSRVGDILSCLNKIYESMVEYFDKEPSMKDLLYKLKSIIDDLNIAINILATYKVCVPGNAFELPVSCDDSSRYSESDSDTDNSADRYREILEDYKKMYKSFLTLKLEKENYTLLSKLDPM